MTATRLSMLPHPLQQAFRSSIVSVLFQCPYSNASDLKLKLRHLDTLLKISVDWKINTLLQFCYMKKKKEPKWKIKGTVRQRGLTLVRTPKGTSTGEFVGL